MGNEHKHYEMIVAKAANFDLIQFIKLGDKWDIVGGHDNHVVNFGDHYDYFLCLPKHNENDQCLMWLKGESVLVKDFPDENRERVLLPIDNHKWHKATVFMDEDCEIRTRPKKEKRWIAFNHENGNVYGTFLSEDKCKIAWPNLQKFQIEVEV